MIVNPFTEKNRLLSYEGTRILQDDFGLIGRNFTDRVFNNRIWTVQGVYTPLRNRTVQGLRIKLKDQKDYTTFINQMDLEVLLGYGRPGIKCPWTGRKYAEPGDDDFFGMCVDDDDLVDDLFDREQLLRAEYPNNILPEGIDMVRKLHLEDFQDIEERLVLIFDGDHSIGLYPDLRLETVAKRWIRVERIRAPYNEAS